MISIQERFRGQIENLLGNNQTQLPDLMILLSVWDDVFGLEVKDNFPVKHLSPKVLNALTLEIFEICIEREGYSHLIQEQELLIQFTNIQRDVFLLFNFFEDENCWADKRLFMLSVFAPKINIWDALHLKVKLKAYFSEMKTLQKWDIRQIWNDVWCYLRL